MIRSEVRVRHDVRERTGMLRVWGSQTEAVSVNFYFDVYTNVIMTPGLPPTDRQRMTVGVIKGQSNESFNEGIYELVTEQG